MDPRVIKMRFGGVLMAHATTRPAAPTVINQGGEPSGSGVSGSAPAMPSMRPFSASASVRKGVASSKNDAGVVCCVSFTRGFR